VLWEPNQPIESVYFPNSGMISLVAVMVNGKTVEVGMTGRHGFVGTPVLLGVQSAPFRAVVQIEGCAFQIQSDVLCKICRHIAGSDSLPFTQEFLAGMLGSPLIRDCRNQFLEEGGRNPLQARPGLRPESRRTRKESMRVLRDGAAAFQASRAA